MSSGRRNFATCTMVRMPPACVLLSSGARHYTGIAFFFLCLTCLYQHSGWLKTGIVKHSQRLGLRGQMGHGGSYQREGASFLRCQLHSSLCFIWKRGRAGMLTLRRAQIVTSTILGMTDWPWRRLDCSQSHHSPKQLLGFLPPSRVSLVWFGHPEVGPQWKQFT